jgi:hypothetical protein
LTAGNSAPGRAPAAIALVAQFFLALALGAWAAVPAIDARHDDMMVYGAVATVFALAFAFAAANGLRLLAGLLSLAGDPSAFLRKFTAPRPGMSDRDRRHDRLARLVASGVHAAVLVVALILIAAVLAALSPADFLPLALRFLGVAAVLSLFTWKALDAV